MMSRFIDTRSHFDREPFVFRKEDQPPHIRMVGNYLADATRFRYQDHRGNRRVSDWYHELMRTTAEGLKAKSIERLEF